MKRKGPARQSKTGRGYVKEHLGRSTVAKQKSVAMKTRLPSLAKRKASYA